MSHGRVNGYPMQRIRVIGYGGYPYDSPASHWGRVSLTNVQGRYLLSMNMENESLFILFTTAVGGYLGLDGSGDAVNEACGVSEGCVLAVDWDTYEIPRMLMEAHVGPVSAIAGLIMGLLVGTVLVGVYRLALHSQSKSDE